MPRFRDSRPFLERALAIDTQAPPPAGALGFMARALIQATLPHSDPKTNEFTRVNGQFTLTMLAPRSIGLPYGSVPRLVLAWITTEAVRTQQPTLYLGPSLTQFMRHLEMTATGGRCGSITRLRDQMQRLFATSITGIYNGPSHWQLDAFRVADAAKLWWHPNDLDPTDPSHWISTLTLGEVFYRDIIEHAVPVGLRVLKVLRPSPLALDIYCWLTYRFSYLRYPTLITWEVLQAQFGADYRHTYHFRERFLDALRKVCLVYPDARVTQLPEGILLSPSRTHIRCHSRGKGR